ncbi:hypothetical protein O174_07825 [Listeria monocytogenes serotype 4bV str. LS644]|nr:hypothetical protein O174_07825 [Listeria monocytogenes serotype 4bV str. LS644]ERH78193.1 hypothetical protein O171_05350 [Listeria monocytogenes serotype 4bV str. LS645]ERH84425.1 hypothetical protein O168_04605 [Listeria monocytogenes serotype 4bV str. LS643]
MLYKNNSDSGKVYNFLSEKLKKLTKGEGVCEKGIFLYSGVVFKRPIIKSL